MWITYRELTYLHWCSSDWDYQPRSILSSKHIIKHFPVIIYGNLEFFMMVENINRILFYFLHRCALFETKYTLHNEQWCSSIVYLYRMVYLKIEIKGVLLHNNWVPGTSYLQDLDSYAKYLVASRPPHRPHNSIIISRLGLSIET